MINRGPEVVLNDPCIIQGVYVCKLYKMSFNFKTIQENCPLYRE